MVKGNNKKKGKKDQRGIRRGGAAEEPAVECGWDCGRGGASLCAQVAAAADAAE